MRFEHKHYDYENFTGKKIETPLETIVMETEAITLHEVIDTFERFLKACGFIFNGKLDFVENDNDRSI